MTGGSSIISVFCLWKGGRPSERKENKQPAILLLQLRLPVDDYRDRRCLFATYGRSHKETLSVIANRVSVML